MNARTFRIGGIHPEENKLTNDAVTKVAALPKQAIFPLSQHIGAPAVPVVQKGDKVKVGTMIADAGGFVSAPIYSSVSGTVFKIDTAIDATGYRKPAIIINVEGDEWEERIDRSNTLETVENHPELTPEEISYYIGKYRPYDKAGAYGIQEWIGYVGITKIEGSYFNIMGLPVHALYSLLQKFI